MIGKNPCPIAAHQTSPLPYRELTTAERSRQALCGFRGAEQCRLLGVKRKTYALSEAYAFTQNEPPSIRPSRF
jgi:hypothetical protein